LTLAATDLPESPEDIAVDWNSSTKTSLMIMWNQPRNLPASLITGYKLEMDDGQGG